MNLKNKIAIVTGGASGLGEACVRRFVRQGVKVLFLDLSDEKGESLETELTPNAKYLHADVSSEADIEHAINVAMDTWGRLDIACNVAGINAPKATCGRNGPYPLKAWETVIRVNLLGTYNVMRLSAQAMAKNEPDEDGERGVIISTSSIAAYHGEAGQTAYSASKGGINGLMLPAARDLSKFGIRVFAIAPGLFETPIYHTLAPEALESLRARTVFPKRLGRPDEFAHAVQCIAENSMFNGDTLRLDGAVRF